MALFHMSLYSLNVHLLCYNISVMMHRHRIVWDLMPREQLIFSNNVSIHSHLFQQHYQMKIHVQIHHWKKYTIKIYMLLPCSSSLLHRCLVPLCHCWANTFHAAPCIHSFWYWVNVWALVFYLLVL